MRYTYPEPQDVGIAIPAHLIRDRFRAGFLHALRGGNLFRAEHLKLSFREGFRAGKLYLRELRCLGGVVTFPRFGKLKFSAIG